MLALLLLAPACSGDGDGGDSATPGPSAGSPTRKTGLALTAGSARLVLKGGVSAQADLSLDAAGSQFNPAPGGFALFWRAGTNLLSMGGPHFTGTRKTSKELALGFSIAQGETLHTHTSNDGGCSITLRQQGSAVDGSFTCADVRSSEGARYSAEGTFQAR
ncbi:MAG: hypothetical protein ACREBP_09075 [Sphingomicrobium sp.]